MSAQEPQYPLHQSIGFHLGRTTRHMVNRLNRLFAENGIPIHREHFIILNQLWQQDGRNQQDIACQMCRDKTAVTRLVSHLERENFVVRIADPNDRRNKLIYLTNGGKELQAQLIPLVSEMIDSLQHGIAASELDTCKQVLTKLFDNLQTPTTTDGSAPSESTNTPNS